MKVWLTALPMQECLWWWMHTCSCWSKVGWSPNYRTLFVQWLTFNIKSCHTTIILQETSRGWWNSSKACITVVFQKCARHLWFYNVSIAWRSSQAHSLRDISCVWILYLVWFHNSKAFLASLTSRRVRFWLWKPCIKLLDIVCYFLNIGSLYVVGR